MKLQIIITVAILTLVSCMKERYHPFSSRELDFVNYSKGQSIKFIDTNLVTYPMLQTTFSRDFREAKGTWVRSRDFYEEYEVSYSSDGAPYTFDFKISISGFDGLEIQFNGYHASPRPDSISPTISSVLINGITYKDVYTLTAHKGYFVSNDTATLYHNKQYGVIQLLYPNGKRFVRTD